jgi:hypothetical protein
VGNEENGYTVPDLNKITKHVTKELSNAYKKTLKEKIWGKTLREIHGEDIKHG